MSFHFAPTFTGATPLGEIGFLTRSVKPRPPSLRPMTLAGDAHQLVMSSATAAMRLSPDPLWAVELSHSADRMRRLAPGWDGPGSTQIPEAIISRAVQLTREALMPLRDPAAPHLAPGGDGSLQIEWHRAHAELEFCLGPDGYLDIWGRDHRTGAEFEGEGAGALDLFRRWAPRTAQRPLDAVNAPSSAGSAALKLAA